MVATTGLSGYSSGRRSCFLNDRMFNARQEGDYKAFTEFSVEDVNAELVEVERFIQRFHTLLAEEKAR